MRVFLVLFQTFGFFFFWKSACSVAKTFFTHCARPSEVIHEFSFLCILYTFLGTLNCLTYLY